MKNEKKKFILSFNLIPLVKVLIDDSDFLFAVNDNFLREENLFYRVILFQYRMWQ